MLRTRLIIHVAVTGLCALLLIGCQPQSQVPSDKIQDSASILLQGLITESDLSSIKSVIDQTTEQDSNPLCSQGNCLTEEANRAITFRSKQGHFILIDHYLERYAPVLPSETDLQSRRTTDTKNDAQFIPRLPETISAATAECRQDAAMKWCHVVIRYKSTRSILNLYSVANSSDLMSNQEIEALLQEVLSAIAKRVRAID
jgi:hypothetical protein